MVMDKVIGSSVPVVCKQCGNTKATLICEGSASCTYEDEMCLEGCPRARLECELCNYQCFV